LLDRGRSSRLLRLQDIQPLEKALGLRDKHLERGLEMKKKRNSRRKKSSASDRSRNSATKDSVTGLFMTAPAPVGSERQRVDPDQVYTVTEADVAGLPNGERSFEPRTYPLQYEFEFSKDFLVGTLVQASGIKFRVAYVGEFGYTNGLLTSAKVNGYADRFWIPEPDGSVFESGVATPVDGQGFAVNPDRIELWFLPSFSTASASYGFSQINAVLTEDRGKSAVTAFGGGKFLADGWEVEPFASNLL
jgi:hypothetical protein